MTPGRWYWAIWEPRKLLDVSGRCVTASGEVADVTLTSFEELSCQHVDMMQCRYQRQPGGPTRGQSDALREMRAQFADDRLKEALGQVGAGLSADPSWQEQVWARIERRQRWRRLLLVAGVVVVLAAGAAWWLL